MGAIALSPRPLRIDVDHFVDEVDHSCSLYLPFYKLPGDAFVSRDRKTLVCTSTGSLWAPYGRLFDGIDDTISIANGAINASLDYSVLSWIKWNALDNSWVWRGNTVATPTLGIGLTNDKGGGANTIKFLTFLNGSGEQPIADSNVVPTLKTWYHVAATYQHNVTFTLRVMKIYVSAVLKATVSPVTPGGTVQGGIGVITLGEATSYFSGVLSEGLVYRRTLSAFEVQRHYFATKWRYV